MMAEIEELRKEFEQLRREKIEAVADKHKDDPLDFIACYFHLKSEYEELVDAAVSEDAGRVIEELVDIANCAEFTFIALRKYEEKHQTNVLKLEEEGEANGRD